MCQESKSICVWSQDSEDSDIWLTGCGEAFTFNEGTPEENGVNYCVFCGHQVEQEICKYEGT